MIIIIDKLTKKKVMPLTRQGQPKTLPHGPKFDSWYIQFLQSHLLNSMINFIFSTDVLII